MQELETFLNMGGNGAMIGLFFLMWRFDRRLLMLEISMQKHGVLLADAK